MADDGSALTRQERTANEQQTSSSQDRTRSDEGHDSHKTNSESNRLAE